MKREATLPPPPPNLNLNLNLYLSFPTARSLHLQSPIPTHHFQSHRPPPTPTAKAPPAPSLTTISFQTTPHFLPLSSTNPPPHTRIPKVRDYPIPRLRFQTGMVSARHGQGSDDVRRGCRYGRMGQDHRVVARFPPQPRWTEVGSRHAEAAPVVRCSRMRRGRAGLGRWCG